MRGDELQGLPDDCARGVIVIQDVECVHAFWMRGELNRRPQLTSALYKRIDRIVDQWHVLARARDEHRRNIALPDVQCTDRGVTRRVLRIGRRGVAEVRVKCDETSDTRVLFKYRCGKQ